MSAAPSKSERRLPAQVPGHVFVDILEHGRDAGGLALRSRQRLRQVHRHEADRGRRRRLCVLPRSCRRGRRGLRRNRARTEPVPATRPRARRGTAAHAQAGGIHRRRHRGERRERRRRPEDAERTERSGVARDLRLGDHVMVHRAGDVIPRIEAPVAHLRTGEERPIEFPAQCPRQHGVTRPGRRTPRRPAQRPRQRTRRPSTCRARATPTSATAPTRRCRTLPGAS